MGRRTGVLYSIHRIEPTGRWKLTADAGLGQVPGLDWHDIQRMAESGVETTEQDVPQWNTRYQLTVHKVDSACVLTTAREIADGQKPAAANGAAENLYLVVGEDWIVEDAAGDPALLSVTAGALGRSILSLFPATAQADVTSYLEQAKASSGGVHFVLPSLLAEEDSLALMEADITYFPRLRGGCYTLAVRHANPEPQIPLQPGTDTGFASPVPSAGRKVPSLHSAAIDETSANIHSAVLDSLHDWVAVTDPEGRFRFLGRPNGVPDYSVEGLRDCSIWDVVYPDDQVRFQHELCAALKESSHGGRTEIRFRCPGHTPIWLDVVWRVLRDSHGSVRELLFVGRDITRYKQTEAALRAREDQYRQLFENSPASLWEEDHSDFKAGVDRILKEGVTDVHTYLTNRPDRVIKLAKEIRLVNVNQAAVELYQAESKADLFERNYEIFSEEAAKGFPGLIAAAEGAVHGKTEFLNEETHRTLKNEIRHVRVHWTVAPGCEQCFSRVLVSVTDLTARRRAEQAVEDELHRARQAHNSLAKIQLPERTDIGLAACFAPATYIGGDLCFITEHGKKLVAFLSDVTGHGLEATLFNLSVKHTVESYLERVSEERLLAADVLAHLNSKISSSGYPSEYALSIFLAIFDGATRSLQFSAAGFHTPPLLVKEGGEITELVSPGLPISPDVPPDAVDFHVGAIDIPDSAYVLFATDGLYEQRNRGVMFIEQLSAGLNNWCRMPAETIADGIYRDFCRFCADEEQHDDVTFFVLSTMEAERFSVPAAFASLETVRARSAAYYAAHPMRDALVMAVHELAANAVEHGSERDGRCAIKVALAPRALMVEDEGSGFDWRARKSAVVDLDLDLERGRGLSMVRTLVGELVFNGRGNRVSLLLPAAHTEDRVCSQYG